MAKPTFLPSPLTIAVPASSNARRALISPATVSSPISPTRSRRQQTHRTRALRARPGGAFLRVPTEAALSAADYIEDMSRSPYGSGQATGRTTEGPLTADTMTGNTTTEDQGESPQLAADDIFELQEFLARKSWISDKISVSPITGASSHILADIPSYGSCTRRCPMSTCSQVPLSSPQL